MRAHPRVLRFVRLAACAACLGAAARAQETAEAAPATSHLRPVALRCEAMVEPRGIEEQHPRLSWEVHGVAGAPPIGARVTAWRVVAASTPARLRAGRFDRFDSGRVAGDAVATLWGGEPLAGRDDVTWQVQVWDELGVASAWSDEARFTVGLLDRFDWGGARWIGAPDLDTAERVVSPWLRTVLELPAAPRRARAWVASVGFHELWIEGRKVGDVEQAPGMVDLAQRVRTVEYDVGAALRAGRNAIGLWLHSGWARHAPYGAAHHPAAAARLDVELVDGRRIVLVTSDEGWWAAPSSRGARGGFEIGDYGGETVDAAREALPWCVAEPAGGPPGIDWLPVSGAGPYGGRTTAACEPDRRRTRLDPIAIAPAGDGAWRVDFGRCFTGALDVAVRGEPGATVALRMSERPDEAMSWNQCAELVLDRAGRGRFVSRFAPLAGRWLTIEGAATAPQRDEVVAWLVRPDLERTGRFACSLPELQRLHDAAAWTWECLTLGGVPVDCPHRERLGYGGDGHATMALGLGSFASAALHARWLDDWAALQAPDGALPFSAPTRSGGGGPAWSGIVVQLAWEHWLRTGDGRTLARAWPTIERWLAWLETRTRDGLLVPDEAPLHVARELAWLDDWMAPGTGPRPSRFDARSDYFQNAYRVGCVRRAAELARALRRDGDAARLEQRGAELAAAVHDRFWNGKRGGYVSRHAVNVLLALFAGLGDAAWQRELFATLVARIESDEPLDTGLHGTWLLVRELLARGRADLLLRVALRDGPGTFQGLLAGGATTLCEAWDGSGSRMHALWLSIGALAPEGVLGIRPRLEAPGYREFDLAPLVAAGIGSARGSVATPHGPIDVAWRPAGRGVELRLTVPVGTKAHLRLPGAPAAWRLRDGDGEWPLDEQAHAGPEGEGAALALPAGRWELVRRAE